MILKPQIPKGEIPCSVDAKRSEATNSIGSSLSQANPQSVLFNTTTADFEQWKRAPGGFGGYVGDEKLPSYIGMTS